jgi:hypothetical protein
MDSLSAIRELTTTFRHFEQRINQYVRNDIKYEQRGCLITASLHLFHPLSTCSQHDIRSESKLYTQGSENELPSIAILRALAHHYSSTSWDSLTLVRVYRAVLLKQENGKTRDKLRIGRDRVSKIGTVPVKLGRIVTRIN